MLLIRTVALRAIEYASHRIRSFRQDDRGAIIVLTLFLFLAMVLVTGVAIDVVRTEHARTKLQGTLDRAILAAASNDNQLDPKQVVLSYFEKAGLGAYMSLDRIAVEDDEEIRNGTRSINFRSVTAVTMANVPTMFLNRVGIDSLPAPAFGRADEGMSPVEIVLVLDVSGSMRAADMQRASEDANGNPILDASGNPVFVSSTRLASLQSSARRFVRTVYNRPENANRVAVAIVPYAWNVNFHAARNSYGRPAGDPDTGCLVLNNDSDYRSEAILPGASYGRSPHADPFSNFNRSWTTTDTTLTPPQFSSYNWECQMASFVSGGSTVQTGQFVLPYTNSTTRLINHINAMTAGGSTSIEIGMKWGVHMIDPSYRSVNQDMINAGLTPATFFRVPNDYGYAGTRKYIVLMTDGENMPSYVLNAQYRNGLSPIFEGTNSGARVYSFHDPSRPSNQFFRANGNAWASTAHGTSPVRLTWAQVWDRLTVSWVAYHLYAKRVNPSNPTSEYNRFYRNVHGDYAEEGSSRGDATTIMTGLRSSDKDARLRSICDSVRDNVAVTVFTIAFNPTAVPVNSSTNLAAVPRGTRSLATCASTFAHFYPAASGQALQSAFDSIAAQILDLRLTQ